MFEKTVQTLRNHFKLHRPSIRNSKKISSCKILFDYYQKRICRSADYTV